MSNSFQSKIPRKKKGNKNSSLTRAQSLMVDIDL